jgi:hypothetical protein
MPTNEVITYDFGSEGQAASSGGTGGGSGGNDMTNYPTREEMNKGLEAVGAKNDARFAEVTSGLNTVLAQISILSEKIDGKPSLNMLVGVAVVGFLAVVAVLAFGGDRFDGGVQVQSTLSESQIESQRLSQENARQIDQILRILEDDQSQEGPAEGQD